ncbi:uncharacterized protein LOC116417922 [Nasonia vitripennis]|uniref:RNase H type-1 domain-containing protein n=1 Tax=Nasonia vitripennis TaxID=7425 RepID=A0A7M7QMY6_NASVI|nr:uncharacterized protein LOC116417922 [Nasonia vitripennis]
MRWIYEAVLKPRLTYGAAVWWKRTALSTSNILLERLRSLIVRSISGAIKSTPTAALGLLLNIEPLKVTLAAAAAQALHRITNSLGKGNMQGLLQLPKGLDEKGILRMNPDAMSKTFLFDKKYRLSIPSRVERDDERINIPNNGDLWYTDGSRRKDAAGAGVYCRQNGVGTILPLSRYTTVLQTELIAIMWAAQAALAGSMRPRIYICSDSKSALQALDSFATKSKLVWDCVQTLNRLALKASVTLLWVPGHNGVKGKMIADDLAKLGAKSDLIGPEPAVRLCQSLIKGEIRQWATNETNRIWEEIATCGKTKAFVTTDNAKDWSRAILGLKRAKTKLLEEILTGNGSLNAHRHSMGRNKDPFCRFCCTEEETPEHLLCNCPAITGMRQRHLGTRFLEAEDVQAKHTPGILSFWEAIGA